MAQQTRNFIAVLIRNDRIAGSDDVIVEFGREINQRLGISEAKVISARKLDEQERKELEKQIAELTGGTVEAQFEEDSSCWAARWCRWAARCMTVRCAGGWTG